MLKLNDIIELEVEKLAYGSFALGRYGEEKFVIFINNAVPNDVLKVKITSLNKKFAHGEIVEIVKPSKYRTKPICALFNACGSCNFQNMEYDFLTEQKNLVLKDIYKNIVNEDKFLPFIKSPEILEYRHKIQYPTRQTKNSKRILMGYFKNNSHDLINIKYCPIQPEIINEITKYIRENFKLDCYSEKTNKGLLKNVLSRISSNKENVLITFVLNIQKNQFEIKYKKYFEEFFKALMTNFSQIKGCFVNFNTSKTNIILGSETLLISGQDYIIEELKDKKYKIGPVSFFQVNPKCAEKLFDSIYYSIKDNSTILDCYGGVGAIGIYLSNKASKITLVEENKNAIICARENFKLNNIKNYDIFEGDASTHLLDFIKKEIKFDYVILDPPRSGCEEKSLKEISKIANNIIYVSCNPQTQKRDALVLIENGFKIKSIQGVDFFPYTYHIESVAIFERQVK